ncbi:FimV N-terminal domain-containing protein [Rheinheimera pacifica]|uniref:FimV N-terminal domain-containing protein n=1 Tax=Rheinheimera pacifica TaxID=173990 RepID=A0A1H6MT38_9GAMM|nr:FimV/HubP family polar landmark protein [Rheinheimera pacifica]SEI02780.1 FimV N-terminal domain-containing protein [Rheinheimera pacifica]
MPWLFVLLITVLVNFSSSLQAQENTTQIRGPRGSDTVTPSQIRGPRDSDTAAPAEQIGPLSPADTLWRVAERVKPAGNISLYQVMYALYLKNPDAFLENNLNHLKPGAILVLPSLQEIQQVDVAIARQKAEQDDQIWAQRQKAAAPKAVTSASTSTSSAAVSAAPQWQAELKRLDEQQRQQLDGLRSQFADSMQLVETMVQENLQLKTSLTKLQQELELLKAELSDDSQIQQQIELLVQQQATLLQARADDEAAAKEAAEQSSTWQSVLQNPLSWILAACVPALLVLFSILLWVKKRGQKTEEVINAARTEPQADPTYHSPLPPLEENDDLDESLFEIDDALLEDAFVDDTILAADSGVDSDLLQFDDALTFEDDSLLPTADTKPAEQPTKPDETFDADNILSDSDLSALFAAADDDDTIVELADNDDSQDDILSEPDIQPDVTSDAAPEDETFDEFDIDDLIEEVALDEDDDELAELTGQEQDMLAALARTAAASAEPEADTETSNAEAEQDITLDDALLAEPEQSFDSSELEEFAESLVAESEAAQLEVIPEYELTDDDEALLNAELSELLDQVDTLDDVAAEDANTNTVTPQDIGLEPLPSEPDSELADELDTTALDATSLDTAPFDTTAIDSGLSELDDALIDDAEALKAENKTLQNLDLTALDDSSVSRPTEAALSVENPSKILEQYPELELADDDLFDEFDPAFELSDINEALTDEAVEIELDPLPEAQFDTLMTELEAMADNLELTDATADEEAGFNLTDGTDTTAAPIAEDFDFADDDFVEIDKLLASAEQQELDPERFNKLNVDVGLDEFADIIGEHEQRDVDREDNGYAAKLDLVRAYIEIDDKESATMLLDDILSSDAPQNVKTEAAKLKQAE